jgi:ATPase subunit of ABC transporter with duplicated ATPase domains
LYCQPITNSKNVCLIVATSTNATADKLQEEQEEHANELAALLEDMELPMKIAAGGELDGFVVQLQGVAFGYPGAPQLFENCEFGITSKSRIVLLGENGNGVSCTHAGSLAP